MANKVSYNGNTYKSITDAARGEKLTYAQMMYRIKKGYESDADMQRDKGLGGCTEKDFKVLAFCYDYKTYHGFSPTLKDITNGLSLSSRMSANQSLIRLQLYGFVEQRGGGRTGIRITKKGTKWVLDF